MKIEDTWKPSEHSKFKYNCMLLYIACSSVAMTSRKSVGMSADIAASFCQGE